MYFGQSIHVLRSVIQIIQVCRCSLERSAVESVVRRVSYGPLGHTSLGKMWISNVYDSNRRGTER